MKKPSFLLILALLIPAFFYTIPLAHASAATYYVANAGNDSCDGTSQTIGTSGSCSWKTIAKVNTSSFNPGDSILFNKGDIWREQLTVPSSGTAGNPITFGAYGTGANPKILGSAAVSTWTNNTVPAVSADLLDESFNATGYDSPTFTETVGAGSTLDEDSTAIADSAGGSSQILKIQKVSPNWAAWATKDLGADKPISYTQFYAYVTAEGLGNSQQLTLFHATDTAGNHVIDLNFRQNADGTYHFVPARYTGGISTTGTASGNVNLNTWYKIEIKYDKTNMQWEWKLDGTSIQSGSLTAAASNGIRNIRLGSLALDAFTLTAYLDALKISSTDYPNAGSTGNTWKATYSATPVGMWFVDSGGTPHVGRLVANDAAAVNTYDWFTDGVNAYVNSGGTTSGFDPDTLWNSEEASVRSYGMFISSKSYITVQDIDVSYAAIIGIFLWADSDNAIIQRNNTSYNYDGGIAGGVNGTAASDNALVTLNTSTYNGHRGISLDDYGSNWTVSRNITHHNAQDYLQNFGGGIVIYGPHGGRHTIEYNTSYSNGTANSSLGNAIGAGIWIDTVAEILGGASATIRYNTIYGNRYHGIFVEKSSNASVYGNLSYNNVDGSASVAGLAVDAYISHAASNDVFYNNTIYGNYVGIRLRSDQSLSGQISNNTFKNNISTGNTLRQFSAILGAENAGIYGSGNVYEYNMFGPEASNFIEWGSGVYKSTYSAFDTAYGASTHSVAGDPLFTTNGSNFTLLSTSPAIDTGVNLGTTYKLGLDPTSTWPSSVSTLNQDANGLGWDIGSYVFTESTAPTVSLTAPTTGSSVSGSSVSLSATASDNSAIAGVQFKLDTNTNIGAEDTTSTYGVAWNSTAVSNGTHTLIAVARDTYGNYATSSAVTVTVNNASVVVVSNVTTPARPPGGHKHDVIIAASTSAPALTLTPSTTPTLSPSHSFTTNHQLWDKGPDIKDLQIYLNDHGFTIAGSGSGSKGNETSTFGTLTFKSLVNYQKSKGLPATGWFGPMTREAMGSK